MRAISVVFLTFLFFFIMFNSAPAPSFELLQTETQSVGKFPMPPEWRVVSKDEVPEHSLISPDLSLNVRQVLYAVTEADGLAALQIFAIWGADGAGNEKPLPGDILTTCEKFVPDLIGGRHGSVWELGTETVETDLEDLSVAVYGAKFSPAPGGEPELRYRCVSLYRGEKRILVLLNHSAEHDDYWAGQFKTLLNIWIGSLVFTPTPAPVTAPALLTSLPAFIPASSSSLPLPAVSSQNTASQDNKADETVKAPTIQPRGVSAPIRNARDTRSNRKFSFSLDRIPFFELALLWSASFYMLYVLYKRGKRNSQKEKETILEPPAPEAEIDAYTVGKPLPTLDEWLAEKPLLERDAYIPPASADGGFEKVYSLFGQVLQNIDCEETFSFPADADKNVTPEEQQ